MANMKKVPLRKCAATGEMFPKKEMIRIVRPKEGEVSVDLTGKKSGRGTYVSKSEEAVETARRNRSIESQLEDGCSRASIMKNLLHAVRREVYQMNESKKYFNCLGIATRARRVVTGEDLAVREVQTGKANLVIISSDASANTMKKITDKCTFFNVEKHVFGSREDLGHAIGKESRVVLAIMDAGFAGKLSESPQRI